MSEKYRLFLDQMFKMDSHYIISCAEQTNQTNLTDQKNHINEGVPVNEVDSIPAP